MKVEKDDVENFNRTISNAYKLTSAGNKFWEARELQTLLQYSSWQRFESVIQRAINACDLSGYNSKEHFQIYEKSIIIGSNTVRKITDYKISKYGCYLIAISGDPAQKEMILYANIYFDPNIRKYEEIQNYISSNTLK